MLIDEALQLSQGMITTREQHPLYYRTTKLRQLYKALKTGENNAVLLRQFVKREDDELFQQRLDLTINITPAITSALEKPYNKLARNNKVRKSYDFKNTARDKVVEQMRDSFYGKKKSKNRGLDYWLRSRYTELQFVDPNAWVVVEWTAPASRAEIVKPKPFEVTSDDAWHWSVIDEETKWLWVHTPVVYTTLEQKRGQKVADAVAAGVTTDTVGDKFTLYDEDYTLVYVQIDPRYLKSIGYVKAANEIFYQDKTTKYWYSLKTFEPKLGFVPAYRVGYAADTETDGATYVNGWHPAMPYLMDCVKSVSEMNLTHSLHVFPQKQQYVQKCKGVDKEHRCDYGRDATGAECRECRGSGWKTITTAQEALYYPFPEPGTTNSEVLDLDKLINYKAPSMNLLTFQKTYIDSLKTDCHYAVFVQTNLTRANGQQGVKTATETDFNNESTYDAIHPFSEKICELFIEFITCFGFIAGAKETDTITVVCVFPADLKWKSIAELLVDLKNARDAGAPPFLIDKIEQDIADIIYEGDEVAQLKHQTKHKFYPFNGQSPDEIALNMASQYVSTFTKVLYSNFEAIFSDIDLENPGFWFLTYDDQWPIVEKMVDEYIAELQTNMMPDLHIGAPGAEGAAPGDPLAANADESTDETDEPLKPGDPGYVDPNE